MEVIGVKYSISFVPREVAFAEEEDNKSCLLLLVFLLVILSQKQEAGGALDRKPNCFLYNKRHGSDPRAWST